VDDAGRGGAAPKPDAKGAGGSAGKGGASGTGGSTNLGGTPDKPPAITYCAAGASTPPASWVNVTGTFAGMQSDCGQFNGVYSNPQKDMLVAGINRNGLYSSSDGGDTWVQLTSKVHSATTVILFDPADPKTFYQSGIYGWKNPWCEGAFVTHDDGASFTGFTNMGAEIQSHNDCISVDFSDPQRNTILSGGHEQRPDKGANSQGLFLSTDAGSNFDDIMPRFAATDPGLGFCTTTLVLSSSTMLVGCSAGWAGGSGAVMRSTDGGATWTSTSTKGVFGQPLWASDGAIYWQADGGGIQKSTDLGVTWSTVADSSKAGTVRPFELPDGSLISAKGRSIVQSKDHGVTWTTVGTALPYDPGGLAYSPCRNAFYVWHNDCGSAVLADAVERSGWDYRL
jgi:hypothetical protein